MFLVSVILSNLSASQLYCNPRLQSEKACFVKTFWDIYCHLTIAPRCLCLIWPIIFHSLIRMFLPRFHVQQFKVRVRLE